MRRVSYKTILQSASQLWTGESVPTPDDAGSLNVFINQRAGEFWGTFWFPEITPAEQRQFRADWATGTSYAAPTATTAVEVYYPRARKYYQSLHSANLGNAPATGTALTENSAHWAESKAEYSEDKEWNTGVVFIVGQKTKNPDDQRYYQCHTAHTAGASFDATKFGILTPFVRDIDYEQTLAAVVKTPIGEVRDVWDKDPNVYERFQLCRIKFDLTTLGVIVRGELPLVWIEFRLCVPSWTATVTPAQHSLATTYGLAARVYDDTEGDYFTSLQAGNLNHVVTDTAWWQRIEIPYVLRDAVPQAAYADMLRTDGQTEKHGVELARARELLRSEIRKIELLQGQSRQMNVVGRN
jgi:hypothetical protein